MNACSSPGVRSMCRSFRSSISLRRISLARSMERHCRRADRAVSAQRFAASVGDRCATMSCTAFAPGFNLRDCVGCLTWERAGRRPENGGNPGWRKGSCCLRRRLPTRCSRYNYCAAVVRLNPFLATRPSSNASSSLPLRSSAAPVLYCLRALLRGVWLAGKASLSQAGDGLLVGVGTSAQHRLPGLLNGLGEVFWQRRLHVRAQKWQGH